MPVPADAVPVLIAVVAYFATFMGVVGGVMLWTRDRVGRG
jgi:hypothetical protein